MRPSRPSLIYLGLAGRLGVALACAALVWAVAAWALS